MGGLKRKDAPSGNGDVAKKQKTAERKSSNRSRLEEAAEEEDFRSFSDNEGEKDAFTKKRRDQADDPHKKQENPNLGTADNIKKFKLDSSSAEAHAKQRALARERKLSKPNADAIQRSKQLWERLRRKSHVPVDERKKLVAELFDLINGRVHDFVFKHDSVRVIQCALKYATREQRKSIVKELKNDTRALVESRYGKFLVAKMVVEGDQEVRDTIVPEFYGHVKRLINHPEASWIVDDIYRQVASKRQKAMMLREWYGAEFALLHRNPAAANLGTAANDGTADLTAILKENPEKRKPILQFLLQMINSLVQKKMTGFTMLHDAMLQYFSVLAAGSEEHTEFLEILKGDIDAESKETTGDLYRNLAFTKSGSKLVCLALAYGSAKDRKLILRVFKNTVETMAFDPYAKLVLVTALEITDDTKMTSKTILYELLSQQIVDDEERFSKLENLVTSVDARVPVLFPILGWSRSLVKEHEQAILQQIFEIRKTTSKKLPEQRRRELVEYMSNSCLGLIAKRTETLVQSSFGCIFIAETLLATTADDNAEAKEAVIRLAVGDPTTQDHIAGNPFAGRMFKALVTGGNFDTELKLVTLAKPRLGFAASLYPTIKDHLVEWACSDSSFVIVALLETSDVPESIQTEVRGLLKNGESKIRISASGASATPQVKGASGVKSKADHQTMAGKTSNAGAKLILQNLS